jgi:hypothetical protein
MTATPSHRAGLYCNPKGLMAYPERRTASGFFLAGAPFVQIVKEEAGLVAAAVQTALADSVATIADPRREEFAAIAQSRLQAAGVRSESAFMRGARLVRIQKEEGAVWVIPHRNGGSTGEKKGFHAISEKKITLPASVDEAVLGSACIQALALCE